MNRGLDLVQRIEGATPSVESMSDDNIYDGRGALPPNLDPLSDEGNRFMQEILERWCQQGSAGQARAALFTSRLDRRNALAMETQIGTMMREPGVYDE